MAKYYAEESSHELGMIQLDLGNVYDNVNWLFVRELMI